jgi:hypothetical protein
MVKWSETTHTQSKKKENKRIAIGLVAFILSTTDGGCHIILVKCSQCLFRLFSKLTNKNETILHNVFLTDRLKWND